MAASSLGISRGIVQLTAAGHIFDVELEITPAGNQYLLKINGIARVDGPVPTIQRLATGKDQFKSNFAIAFGWEEAAPAASFPAQTQTPPKDQGNQLDPDYLADVGRWRAAGGHGDPIPYSVWVRLKHTKPAMSVLEIGSGWTMLAADRAKQPGRHAVVSDCKLTYKHATEVHPVSWKPKYGQMFNVIVVSAPLPDGWRGLLPKLLEPSGDVYVLPSANQNGLVDELSKAWGYDSHNVKEKTGSWFGLFVPPEPLGEGPGTLMVEDLKASGMPTCQQCINLVREMNKWFAAEGTLENHMNEIVKDMLSRARAWWDNVGFREKVKFLWRGNAKLVQAGAMGLMAGKGDIDYALGESIRQEVRDCERRWIELHPPVEVQTHSKG